MKAVKSKFKLNVQIFLIIISSLFFFSCGIDTDTVDDIYTGSYAFSIIWQDLAEGDRNRSSQSLSDCGDIVTVEAFMYDDASDSLLSSGSWPCSAHQGKLNEIPEGKNRRVCVIGKNADGYVLYLGEEDGIEIIADQTGSSQSPIVAQAFLPPEITFAPGNGSAIDPSTISFLWSAVFNASGYRIIISENSDLSSPTRHDEVTDTGFAPANIFEGKTYYWEIYSIDLEGNSSVGTGIQSFTTSDTVPDPFTFKDQSNVSLNTEITSNTITVNGIDTTTPISISGGTYSVNSGEFTDSNGTVNDSDSVRVSITSSSSYSTKVSAELNIGGVIDTFDVTTNFTNSFGMTFNLLSAGTFMMGSPTDEPGRMNNETQHEVTLTQDFYMQTTEVTQGQWEAVLTEAESREISIGGLSKTPSNFSSCGSGCPVETISWDDIQIFIIALNQLGEGTYNLPTEAQWEYAARAGSTTAFANGDITVLAGGLDPNLEAMGWYWQNTGALGISEHGTKPVSQKDANAWGLYDMHGNVWEWCLEWYEYDLGSDSVIDPTGPSSGYYKPLRGGSWKMSNARACRSASRHGGSESAGDGDESDGFRLIMLLSQ